MTFGGMTFDELVLRSRECIPAPQREVMKNAEHAVEAYDRLKQYELMARQEIMKLKDDMDLLKTENRRLKADLKWFAESVS